METIPILIKHNLILNQKQENEFVLCKKYKKTKMFWAKQIYQRRYFALIANSINKKPVKNQMNSLSLPIKKI